MGTNEIGVDPKSCAEDEKDDNAGEGAIVVSDIIHPEPVVHAGGCISKKKTIAQNRKMAWPSFHSFIQFTEHLLFVWECSGC